MNELAVYASPLPFSNKQEKIRAVVGSTVAEIVELATPASLKAAGIGAIVQINGHVIPKKYWHNVRPKEKTVINVRIVPQGGGGKKNPLTTILSIAVLVAAPQIGAALATSAGMATATSAGLISWNVMGVSSVALFTAGAGIVGSMLVSALAPPPKPSNAGASPAASPTHFIEGARNSLNPFGAIPICLGTNRMFPLQAALPFTEFHGGDQYVRQLFTFGYGNLTLSDLKMGETPLSQFSDVELEHKLAGDLHTGTQLYSNDVFQDGYNVLLSSADGYLVRTTQANIDEAVVDISFPVGLASYQNKKGFKEPFTVSLEIQYAPTGTSNWVSVSSLTVTGAQVEAIRRYKRIVFPQNGTYDIRIRRLTPDANDDKISDKTYLTALRSIKYQNPVKLPGLSGTAMRMRATDQLNGAVDQYNAIVSNAIPDYDAASGTWIVRATSNPASLFRYVLQGEANARPLADSKLDLIALQDWHTHCAQQGYTYNRVIDYETSVDAILRDIASAGAASPAIVDGRRTVVIDRLKDDIVQIITPRNSSGYSGEMLYPEMPHAFRVQFRNAAKGYQQDERIVYDDGYSQYGEVSGTVAATEFEALELQYCTNSALAFKTARRHLAAARLRPETHSFMMDVENLVALRGDRIKLVHDVPLVGLGDGRIKNLLTAHTVMVGEAEVYEGPDQVVIGEPDQVLGFTLDDTVSLPASSTYFARVRLSDGTWLYREVTASAGDQQIFLFVAPVSLNDIPLATGDLAYIVEAGSELDLIITRIEPQGDLSARITAQDYAPAIFTAESKPIPPFRSNITTPLEFIRPAAPVLIEAQSDEGVMLRNSDGSFLPRAVFTLRNTNEGDVTVQVKVRRSGTDIFTNANILEASPEQLVLTGLEDGVSYDIHIRYQRRGSTVLSLPLQLNGYKFVGASGTPDDVQGFVITVSGENALFKWTANDDIDLSHYRIKFSSAFSGVTWGTAQLLEDLIYENRVTLPFQPGTYLIKAVDLSGNESASATSIITYNPGIVANAVEIINEAPDFAGEKFNVVVEGDGIILGDESLGDGYYYFENGIDLTGLFTSFVSASIQANGVFFNNIFEMDDIFAEDDIFGGGTHNFFDIEDIFAEDDIFGIGGDAWEVQLEYRTTAVDPVNEDWTEWKLFTAGTIEFWAAEFRILLRSRSRNITPKISVLSVTVDMPDRIERWEDLTVPVEGVSLIFTPEFKNTPAVSVTIQDGDANDEIEFTAKTAGELAFKVYNTTVAGYVERSCDVICSGYGRKTA